MFLYSMNCFNDGQGFSAGTNIRKISVFSSIFTFSYSPAEVGSIFVDTASINGHKLKRVLAE